MANKTPKRIAAAILLQDLEIITGYWQEKNYDIGDCSLEDIQDEMAKILNPFENRLTKIAKNIKV